jgi:hypothetical protein
MHRSDAAESGLIHNKRGSDLGLAKQHFPAGSRRGSEPFGERFATLCSISNED